jgi:hypothetical protein
VAASFPPWWFALVVRGVIGAHVGVVGGRRSKHECSGRYVHRRGASWVMTSLVGFGPAAHSPTLRRLLAGSALACSFPNSESISWSSHLWLWRVLESLCITFSPFLAEVGTREVLVACRCGLCCKPYGVAFASGSLFDVVPTVLASSSMKLIHLSGCIFEKSYVPNIDLMFCEIGVILFLMFLWNNEWVLLFIFLYSLSMIFGMILPPFFFYIAFWINQR